MPIKSIDSLPILDSSKKWLRSALDPFHDYQLELSGYPDATSCMTVVNTFVDTVNISKPASAAGNWDCIISNQPRYGYGSYTGGAASISAGVVNYESTPTQSVFLGCVSVNAADTGQALWPNDAPALWTPTNFQQTNLVTSPSGTADQRGRIIAQAIEVHNTTAELYKQGTVTIGKFPQVTEYDSMQFVDADATLTDGRYPTVEITQPPSLLDEAIQFPNVVQYEAAKGAYCVVGINQIDNPFHASVHRLAVAHRNSSRNSGYGTVIEPGASSIVTSRWCVANTDTSFIFFSGLSNESTLTVSVKTVIEYIPHFGDALLPMATPSPPYDPLALQIYSEAMHKLPPGVPVNFNDAGRWFRMILSAISVGAPLMGRFLDPMFPGAGAAGAVVGTAAGAVSRVIPKKKKKNGVKKQGARQTFVKLKNL